MAEPLLIPTKLRPPRVTSPLIDRPRLRRRLDAHPGRIVLVSASAGFGKTVLIADWAARRRMPSAWLSLDGLDNDPSRFCTHLAAAVASLGVAGADGAARSISELTSPDLPLPPRLLDALATMGSGPMIVLDDLHEIRSPEVMTLLENLVSLQGPYPRLVFLTREDPAFAAGRLRVGGELLELRARDLRFTGDEAVLFFERLLPGILDPAQVRRLERRTEGWAAGLRLAAIALHDVDDPEELVASFAGTHRLVMDYLLEEALGRQTPSLQTFLMETSILGRFSRESCVAVTGDPRAGERLDQVEAAGLFLVPLGDDRAWYRYHHLFADLLRFRMAQRHASRLEELHGRASAWYEADGDMPAALEQASRMRDPTRLLELLDACVLDMLRRGEMGALRYWLGKLDDPLAQPYPMVLCIVGWLRVVTDRDPDLQPVLDRIAAALDTVPPAYDPARRRRARLHIEALSAYDARYAGRYMDAIRIGEAARVQLVGEPLARGLLTYNTARARMTLGEMEPAARLLEEGFGDHLRSGNLYLTLASLGRTAAILVQTEGVGPASESMAAARAFAQERGLVANGAFSIVLYHQGSIEYLANDLDASEKWFGAAFELAGPKDFPEERGNALVGLARVALARGSFEQADALLVEAAAMSQGSNVDLFDTTLAIERSRLTLARERGAAALPMPPLESSAGPGELWTTARETRTTLAIAQAVHQDRHDAAAVMTDELERQSARLGRGPALCVALLARALLPGRPDRWEVLDEALGLAASRGYMRPILDGGEPVRVLLRSALTRDLSSAARLHARRVLDAFEAEPTNGSAPLTPASALPEPLTSREEEVLECLFQGSSNKAIAASLFVSVDTVKTHLKHVYVKLGAANRAQAVDRARELGFGA